MTQPLPAPDESAVPVPAPKRKLPSPLATIPAALAAVAALLLLGGVLFAMASASANRVSDGDRFRLLAQAANPFIAFLALTAAALVAEDRRAGTHRWAAATAAFGVATSVSLTVALLAVNGILTDATGNTTQLFRYSAIVSRVGTLTMSGVALWLAVTQPRKR